MSKNVGCHEIQLRNGALRGYFEIFIPSECYSVKFGLDISEKYYQKHFDGITEQIEAINLGVGLL